MEILHSILDHGQSQAKEGGDIMPEYFTSGQVARKLRVSVSTLKRWIGEREVVAKDTRNASGWMLFSENDLDDLLRYKKEKRRNGKHFTKETLKPVS